MSGRSGRTLPRPFALHWGSGHIVEEATYVGRYHQPSVQLLEFQDGSLALRFCYYDHAGRFQRSPLILGRDEIEGLREALARTPRLRALLEELAGCR
ncbi:MAG TPA: hypothetical protein VNL95_08805 [Dehalococcoidia bacterium]|nr:hypothetical protein [Dehalococcoidia bacterium]